MSINNLDVQALHITVEIMLLPLSNLSYVLYIPSQVLNERLLSVNCFDEGRFDVMDLGSVTGQINEVGIM